MQSSKQSSGVTGANQPAHSPAVLRAALLVLILLHIAVCCLSLVKVADYQSYMPYDRQHLFAAIVLVAAFSVVSPLFAFSRFSFGYFVGFYLYTMVLGFLWLTRFTQFHYDTNLAAASAAASAMLFLLPALLIQRPFRQVFVPSRRNFERLLAAMLALTVATIFYASIYSFRLSSLAHIYEYRDEIQLPTVPRYLIGIVTNALLPFAFAAYLALRSYGKATVTLLLFPFFYPILLSKLVFFAPAWILGLAIVSRWFEARMIVISSLLAPLLLGVVLIVFLAHGHAYPYFNYVNIRMMATPSSALDFYNDFFAHHPYTHFCQVSVVRLFTGCLYQEPLAIVMQDTYRIGNLNASLFATEGVASVGLILAPLAAFACGLVIAIGNKASSGLPARFILISGAVMPQLLLNVPLTITLVSYGAALLFLLWYITPRTIFEQSDMSRDVT
jgi:hypothetical protein